MEYLDRYSQEFNKINLRTEIIKNDFDIETLSEMMEGLS